MKNVLLRGATLACVLSFCVLSGKTFAQNTQKPATDLSEKRVSGNDSTGWKVAGVGNVNFSQVGLTNWAQGGQSSISLLGIVNLSAKYKKGKLAWENYLDLAFGIQKIERTPFQKNDDRLELTSKIGREARKHLYYAGLANLKTQMTPTFTESRFQSGFFSPAFLLLALGMEYKPNPDFSVFLSPVTGKFTFVADQGLADAGAFGVTAAKLDTAGNIIQPGLHYRQELGAYIMLRYRREIMKNVIIGTKLELFNNYTDPNIHNRKNIDVNWETAINFKVNKYISASIFTHLIYDNDILIDIDDNEDGTPDRKAPRTQFKEVLGIGLSYKF